MVSSGGGDWCGHRDRVAMFVFRRLRCLSEFGFVFVGFFFLCGFVYLVLWFIGFDLLDVYGFDFLYLLGGLWVWFIGFIRFNLLDVYGFDFLDLLGWFGEEHEEWSSCPGEEEEQCSSEK